MLTTPFLADEPPVVSTASGVGPLLTGSAWLIATTAVVAGTGFVFWLLAARSHSQEIVGQATALYSALLFVTYVTNMGLPIAVARYAAGHGEQAETLFAWSLGYSVLTSAVGAVLLVALDPHRLLRPTWQWGHPAGLLIVGVLAIAFAVSTLVDVRMMTLRMWPQVFWRAALAGVVRVVLVTAHTPIHGALWIFVSFGGSLAVSAAVGVLQLRSVSTGRPRLRPLPPQWAAALRYANVNYAGQLAVQGPFMLLPLLVAIEVPSALNGSFYVAWSIAGVIFIVPQVIGQALLVEGGRAGSRMESQARVAVLLGGGFAVAAVVASIVGSPAVPLVFGRAYERSAHLLPLLVLPAIPWAYTSAALAVARVRHDGRVVIAITTAFALGVLGPAVLLGHAGVNGAVEGWACGHLVAAVTSFVALKWRHDSESDRIHVSPG